MKAQVEMGHGDVLFTSIKELPDGVEKLNGNTVQEGEHTGHAHRLTSGEFEIFQHPVTKTKFLRVVKKAKISHEEHNTKEINPGLFRIGITKEFDYDAMEQRQVVD